MSNENAIDALLEELNHLREKISEIRKICVVGNEFKKNEGNKLLNEGILDLIKIKKLNEIVQINLENKKEESDQIKDELGKEKLNLEKYKYHLDLIINNIYTNNQLPNLPESKKVIGDEKKNKNDIKPDIFENILKERTKLNEELNEFINKKRKNEDILKNKQNKMKEFPKQIENLEKETNKSIKLINDCKK